jgi:hypothetical protein
VELARNPEFVKNVINRFKILLEVYR